MADADALREAGVPSRLPTAPDATFQPSPSPAPLTPAPAAAPPAQEKVMTLVDHLTELRRRIFICIAAVVLGSAVGFYYSGQLVSLLKTPLPPSADGKERVLNFLAPGEAFFIYVKLALVVGIILAMPVILFQVWRFVSPGLTPDERRIARPWVPVALLFFLLGVAVAWVVLPFAMQFLIGFESKDFVYLPTADAYFGFISTLFLAFGLTMEFPIVLVLLSKVGIITSQRLRSSRRIVILGIAIFAAVVTPGGDLVSPTVLGGVMYLLFELSIRLVKMGGR
jgi:sec-independent protein translocase protein TatC